MIACLFSGGKDSTLALHRVFSSGRRVDLLITIGSENEFSYMFHKPNVEYTRMQAEALGIKQVFSYTKGEKELELADLKNVLSENDIDTLITGATASMYQKVRIDNICKDLKITHESPLWLIDGLSELNELAKNFNIIITRVAADGLDNSYLGKRIDDTLIKKLQILREKKRISLTFEGGEAESFALDGPLFKKSLQIKKSHIDNSNGVGTLIIDSMEFKDK
ncbi:MAG: diphthine--ammonia ligase [Candidatus Marsarchaeota archaeon]|nr:diphthine--ammonia ligase [Candidatus Marsarchaeota archaeon]